MENTPEFPAVDAGLPRRTVLTGAAWTIPVIAAATIAPTASASGTLQLAFDKSTYNGTACSTITGAYVTATTNGVPTTGASVTVSLSNGYTFSGGSATATGYSGTNGRFTLPDINVPSMGGTATVQATSGSAGAAASAKGVPAASTVTYYGHTDIGGIPASANLTDVAVWSDEVGGYWAFALASDGNLYWSLNGSTFDLSTTNVTHLNNANASGIWSKTDNTVTYYGHTDIGGIPASANLTDVAVWSDEVGGYWAFALASDGNLYWSLNGSTFDLSTTNVTHLNNANASGIWSKTASC
ncbi:hypothetical protein AB0O90_07390 [Microbacterium testaceum]|uniref:hypothetical protein n=1 Tax=Microbacterium testaceum TaxID=2033 RepID=UPI00342968B9